MNCSTIETEGGGILILRPGTHRDILLGDLSQFGYKLGEP